MYSRIVNCTIDPAKVGEFKTALNNEFLPRIQAHPGFIDNIESLDPATGQFSCMTLWEWQPMWRIMTKDFSRKSRPSSVR